METYGLDLEEIKRQANTRVEKEINGKVVTRDVNTALLDLIAEYEETNNEAGLQAVYEAGAQLWTSNGGEDCDLGNIDANYVQTLIK